MSEIEEIKRRLREAKLGPVDGVIMGLMDNFLQSSDGQFPRGRLVYKDKEYVIIYWSFNIESGLLSGSLNGQGKEAPPIGMDSAILSIPTRCFEKKIPTSVTDARLTKIPVKITEMQSWVDRGSDWTSWSAKFYQTYEVNGVRAALFYDILIDAHQRRTPKLAPPTPPTPSAPIEPPTPSAMTF